LSSTPTRPAAPTLSHVVNLATVLGTTQAYVGFTSGTGAAFGNHDILTWQFDNAFAPIGGGPAAIIPTLTNAALAALALLVAAVAFAQRRRVRR
jgi:hypothetical protein